MVKSLTALRWLAVLAFALLSASAAISTPTVATPAAADVGGSETIGQLRERLGRLELEHARLQQENQTMLTQLQVLETRKKLKVAQQDEGVGVLPQIVSLSRLDEKWLVRLLVADGTISSFSVGDVPQRGLRIVEISAAGVKVESGAGKQARQIPLAFAGASAGATGAPGAPMPMPMPMPMVGGPVR